MKNEKPNSRRSSKIAGYLFLLAGALMIVPGMFFEGAQTSSGGIAIMFLIFGIVFLSRNNRQTPD